MEHYQALLLYRVPQPKRIHTQIMGSEAKNESSYTPKLPLLFFSSPQPYMQSPERSGTLTPPYQSPASVPFRWEDEPGKPKPCTTLTVFSNDLAAKCLELPPRLLQHEGLEGGRIFQSSSSSFRIGSECYGSFRAGSPERLGSIVLSKRGPMYKENGFLGCWKRRRALKGTRAEAGWTGNSYVFPSSGARDSESNSGEEEEENSVKMTRIKRVGSFHSKSKIWATIYQGLKLTVPWSKRGNKDGFWV